MRPARSSFDAAIREDPTREAGVFRDVVTGEHVCVQGGHSFVEVSWMDLPENKVGGKARVWDMVTHYHPDRGLIIDRISSGSDFDVISYNQRAGLAPRGSVQSTIVWTDAKSRIRFETQFGYAPVRRDPTGRGTESMTERLGWPVSLNRHRARGCRVSSVGGFQVH